MGNVIVGKCRTSCKNRQIEVANYTCFSGERRMVGVVKSANPEAPWTAGSVLLAGSQRKNVFPRVPSFKGKIPTTTLQLSNKEFEQGLNAFVNRRFLE